jgi:hypothetical protein
MLIHPNPRYLVRGNVIQLLQAFLDTGGKSRADIKYHAAEIKDSIRGIHLPNSEAKSLLLGLLANLIDGSSLSRGFISAMTEAGLIPTGEIAYVGGIYPNGEVFHKRNREAQLAYDVQLLEGNVEHRAKPIKQKPRRAITNCAIVIQAIKQWRKENFPNYVIKANVRKVPSYSHFCDMAGCSAHKNALKSNRSRSTTVYDQLLADFRDSLKAPESMRLRG